MKKKFVRKVYTLIIAMVVGINYLHAQEDLDRKDYYKALSSDDVKVVDAAVAKVKTNKALKGFEGALWMRKAGLAGPVNQKFSFFKKGASLMDEAINADAKNTELKFLRFMVQEQAPWILNYRDHLKSDAQDIKKNYKTLSKETLYALKGYCTKSDILKVSDFKFDQ